MEEENKIEIVTNQEHIKDKPELIAIKSFDAIPELAYIVDFLNKSLKNKNVMFGLTKTKNKDEMTVSIYEF